MNYETLVNKAFASVGITPRTGQAEAVDQILTELYTNHKRNVILSADTGTGKSIIGAIVAICVAELDKTAELSSFILMQNNALVDQYARTFSKYGEDQFFQVQGASNYPCDALRKLGGNKFANADSCVKDRVPDAVKNEICGICDYALSRRFINSTMNLITNYSYYFVSKMWSKHLTDRSLTIFDEAHTINDVFCEHNAIHVTAEKLEAYAKESTDMLGGSAMEASKNFGKLRIALMSKKVNESNYISFLKSLLSQHKEIHKIASKQAEDTSDLTAADKLSKLGKKHFGLGCKIGDLILYDYEHVFEFKHDEYELSVKPLFVGSMNEVILGPKNLFMSATITKEFMETTLQLNASETVFIKLPPVFDPDNKTIMFYKPRSLNYAAMQKSETLKGIATSVTEIVKAHSIESRERGIILTPSFVVTKLVTDTLSRIPGLTVISQVSGDKAGDLVKKFKGVKGPAVLVSPSIYEGIDFPDDESRFQIIIKAPYPSLADKRIKEIANGYSDVYRLMTLMKVIQGIGRSVRSADDWSTCYILDSSAKSLFESHLNIWKDQFTLI